MARLIVPTDYSTAAENALDQALLLAKKGNDEIELLHIIMMPPSTDSPRVLEYILSGKKDEEARLKELANARIKALRLPATTRWRVKVLYTDNFLSGIMNRFRSARAKLIVMGTTGVSGIANKIFGSNTANLIGRGEVPVLVIPPEWKTALIKKLEFCMTPEQVHAHQREIKKWATWFGAEASAVYFKRVADVTAPPKGKSPFPIKTVLTVPQDALWEDLVEYGNSLKESALAMFVHERITVFERIFDRSVTGQVAGRVHIPMLAMPVKAE
ncbi:MAG: universal stress protein [Saprospiraceae bacterium]|nr:universal stress protein [Saprospiraceae bacterium]MCF8251437.1 universal stress protein [Saprospiraceae bacterium]MCF8282565.1 universal stress protein [Bacteroidales bacterium]MCF8313032.1 universal stress protein [Saprospiraceae bacterium]MCF8441479.1 universal stress protein [Saprospiraceae bacterium]